MKTPKDGILRAMRTADGKPIKELTELFTQGGFGEKMAILFDVKYIDNANDLINAIDNNFEKIFKLVE